MQRLMLSFRLKSITDSLWKLGALRIRLFGTSSGNCHLHSTNNHPFFFRREEITVYWEREPYGSPMQQEIVNSLILGERNRASYQLSKLVSGGQAFQAGDLAHILEYCARTPDPLFAMETLKLIEEREIPMNAGSYFLTIRALCKGGYLKEAFNMVSVLGENSNLTPTLPMYNNLLQSCVKQQSLNYANKCLQMMEHQAVGKSEITYGLLLQLAVLQHDLSAVHEILKTCIKSYPLSIITLRKIIWSFTMLKDLESAYVALQQMVVVAFQHRFSFAKTDDGKFHDLKLDVPIPYQDKLSWNSDAKDNCISNNLVFGCIKEENPITSHDKVNFFMDAAEVKVSGLTLPEKSLSGPVMKLLRWSFNDLIHTSVRNRRFLLAKKLILQMQKLGLEPSSCSYDGYIRAQVYLRQFRGALEVLRVMEQKNMRPHDSTLAVVSVSCSRSLKLDLAEKFLDQISKCPHTYPYNALLEACGALDQLERAIRVFSKMKSSNILPDIRTYELLFKLFGNVNSPYEDGNMWSQVDVVKRINALEKDMMRHGIRHSIVSMQNLLSALGMEGMTNELIQYLRAAEKQFSLENTYAWTSFYNIVLHSLVETKEMHMAVEVFKSMMSSGFSANDNTYNIMIDCCSIIKCYRSASALFSRMIRDGFCLHKVTYTLLIKVLLKSGSFDESLRLLELARLEGIRLDVLSYNTILKAAEEKGRIDVIELIVEQMHQEKIKPDPSTCNHVFSAYVKNGFGTTAMEALQVLSMRMVSKSDSTLQKTRLKYEKLIYDEDVESESQIIEVFKRYTNLAVALLQLRWCATLGYPISWFPNQSPWAKRLSADYSSRRPG